jgi:hypothetical protein
MLSYLLDTVKGNNSMRPINRFDATASYRGSDWAAYISGMQEIASLASPRKTS